jgi:hypothetical protein
MKRSVTVACPQCFARAEEPCRSRSGRAGPAHKVRIMLAYHVSVRAGLPPTSRTRIDAALGPGISRR